MRLTLRAKSGGAGLSLLTATTRMQITVYLNFIHSFFDSFGFISFGYTWTYFILFGLEATHAVLRA